MTAGAGTAQTAEALARSKDRGETSAPSAGVGVGLGKSEEKLQPQGKRQSVAGRRKLFDLPSGVYEIPGRPHMIFKVIDYESAEKARREIPFLFQAFEAGQEPPPAMKKKKQSRKKKHKRQKLDLGLNSIRTNASSTQLNKIDQVQHLGQSHHHGLALKGEGNGTGTAAADQTQAQQQQPNVVNPKVIPAPVSGGSGLHPPTIHEYLDWTVTANCTRPNSEEDVELDFEGFRVVTVCGRHRPNWPRPGEKQLPEGAQYAVENEQFKLLWMGETLPPLSVSGAAYSAATLRSGYGGKNGGQGKYWIEVPFFATASTKRGRGFGRCLLDAIEHICDVLCIDAMHLCSTNDQTTTCIWRKLGFTQDEKKVEENLAACGITLKGPGLLHMDNTVQMFKHLPTTMPRKPKFSRMRISHKSHIQVLYYQPTDGNVKKEKKKDSKAEEGDKGVISSFEKSSIPGEITQVTEQKSMDQSVGNDMNKSKDESNIYSMSTGSDDTDT
jgi:hypothetical protein